MSTARICLLIMVSAWLAGCSATGPMNLNSAELQQAPAALTAEKCELADPTDHILAIDRRGDYRPITVDCGNGKILHQVRPDQLAADGCREIHFTDQRITDKEIDDYAALQCQIDRIIEALIHPRDGKQQHLVIFIHGGLVGQEASLARALADIPQMVIDEEALQGIPENPPASAPAESLMRGSRIFPLFLNWPSGPFDTYGDAITHYEQGIYDGPERHLETPLYLGNDLAEIGVRAPLDLVKSLHRFVGSQHELASDDQGCLINEHFGCNQIGAFHRPLGEGTVYALTTPFRIVTVPALDVGTRAWQNMIARTRFGVDKYVDPQQYQKVFLEQQPASGIAQSREQKDVQEQQQILAKGAFYLFFDRFQDKLYGAGNDPHCDDAQPRITLIGHSMGTMVSNELLREFPRLPYENIVFMAAATSIRDFKAMTEPVLRRPLCSDLRFYDLTLHQEWDAREIEVGGAAPMGSLLEWIDDIFETPLTPIDRTLGKWQNVVYAVNEFDTGAIGRMFFHRFGLAAPDPLMHGEFAVLANPDTICKAIPYWRPQFWADVRELDGDTCNIKKTLVHIYEGVQKRPLARPNAPEE